MLRESIGVWKQQHAIGALPRPIRKWVGSGKTRGFRFADGRAIVLREIALPEPKERRFETVSAAIKAIKNGAVF
jgi:hypothetical protein